MRLYSSITHAAEQPRRPTEVAVIEVEDTVELQVVNFNPIEELTVV